MTEKQAPRILKLTGGDVRFQLAQADEGKPAGPRRFRMTAYTGDVVMVAVDPWKGPEPVVFDLAGMDTERQSVPVLAHHSTMKIAGHSDKVNNTGRELELEGVLSSATETGREIAQTSDEGFPWQASVGLHATQLEEIQAGDEVEVNGRSFRGPLIVARKSTHMESSFVPFGADSATTAIALERAKEPAMTEKKTDAKPTGATIAELEAAFPNDPKLVIEAAKNSLTVVEAKALAFERLEAKRAEAEQAHASQLEAARAEAEAARAELAKAKKNPPVATHAGSTVSASHGSAREQWDAAVARNVKAGMKPGAAVSLAAKKHPELQRQMLEEANGGLTPRDFKLTGVYAS